MNLFKKSTKAEVFMSVVILFWIFAVNIVTPMLTTAPAWPMFFVTIFFFTMGGELKNALSIFLSGLFGICSAWALVKLLAILSPDMGVQMATALLVFAVLTLIIVGGNFVPSVFNNIAFGYLTIAAIDMTIVEERFVGWVLMHIIGGVIILGGVLLISMVCSKLMQKNSATQEAL